MAWFDFGPSRVYYEITGQGPPLLYLPGVTEFIANHAELLGLLSQSYRVIAADLPGSGRSLPQPRLYHRDYHSEDANAFLALLDQEAPGQKPHLLGFSDGGEVALSLATQAPERSRSVLVWGSAGFIHDPGGQIAAAFHAVVDDPAPAMASTATARTGSPTACRTGWPVTDPATRPSTPTCVAFPSPISTARRPP